MKSITGDFFGTEDIGELCSKIKGVMHTSDALADALSSVDIGSYISGAEATDIIDLFF